MGTRSLLGDAGDGGQLGCGECLTGHQCGENFCPRVIADQSGDTDDVGAVFHGSMLNEPFEHDNSLSWNGTKGRSEEHTSELQSLMRISYAVFCLKKKTNNYTE